MDSLWPWLKTHIFTTATLCPALPWSSAPAIPQWQGAEMRGWEALKGKVRDGWKPPWLRSQGSASCAGGRCDLVWLQRQEVKEEEDNEGICDPGCSCSRQGGARLTDKTGRKTEEGKASKRSAQDEDGTSNRGLGPGCWETHSCLAQRKMGQWDAGRMDGTNKPVLVKFLSCKCLHYVTYLLLLKAPALLPITVCILMSTSFSVWICIYMRQ